MRGTMLADAVILAAGFGTRLGKFGEETPKGLIETSSDQTIIGETLTQIRPLVKKIFFLVNGRFEEKYDNWLNKSGWNSEVEFLSNGIQSPEKRNGAIADLQLAIDTFGLGSGNIFVCPSDTHFEFPLKGFIDFCKKKPEVFATILQKKSSIEEIKNRLGCAVIENDKIVNFLEKPENPPSLNAVVPFYYYPKSYITYIKRFLEEGGNPDAPSNIIPWMLANKIEARAYVASGKALDVGTLEDVEKLKELK